MSNNNLSDMFGDNSLSETKPMKGGFIFLLLPTELKVACVILILCCCSSSCFKLYNMFSLPRFLKKKKS